jgi:hypothetical protein
VEAAARNTLDRRYHAGDHRPEPSTSRHSFMGVFLRGGLRRDHKIYSRVQIVASR